MDSPSQDRVVEIWTPLHPVVLRALAVATEHRSANIGTPHLAVALLERDAIAEIVEACGADAELLRYAALATIDEMPRRRWWQRAAPVEDRALSALYSKTIGHAMASELDRVSEPFLLVTLLAEEPPSPVAERLDALGLELLPVRRLVAHGTNEEPALEDGFGAGRVRVMNDPFTPFEVVTEVFETCFNLPADRAERLMRRVHERGTATFPVDDWERARRRVLEARRVSQSQGYALRLSLERRA